MLEQLMRPCAVCASELRLPHSEWLFPVLSISLRFSQPPFSLQQIKWIYTNPTVYRHHIFFIHSSVDLHQGSFCVLAVVNRIATDMNEHACLE